MFYVYEISIFLYISNEGCFMFPLQDFVLIKNKQGHIEKQNAKETVIYVGAPVNRKTSILTWGIFAITYMD